MMPMKTVAGIQPDKNISIFFNQGSQIQNLFAKFISDRLLIK